MLGSLDVFSAATHLSRFAARQQAIVSENLANIDTPAYRSKTAGDFKVHDQGESSALSTTRPGHVQMFAPSEGVSTSEDRDAEPKPNGNTVSLETETLRSIEAERMHSRAMAIYQSSLNILRSSIGRGR